MNKKSKKRTRKELLVGMGFILPSLCGFLVFTFIPVLISLFLSFTKWNFMEGWGAIKFTGLSNYIPVSYTHLMEGEVRFRSSWEIKPLESSARSASSSCVSPFTTRSSFSLSLIHI